MKHRSSYMSFSLQIRTKTLWLMNRTNGEARSTSCRTWSRQSLIKATKFFNKLRAILGARLIKISIKSKINKLKWTSNLKKKLIRFCKASSQIIKTSNEMMISKKLSYSLSRARWINWKTRWNLWCLAFMIRSMKNLNHQFSSKLQWIKDLNRCKVEWRRILTRFKVKCEKNWTRSRQRWEKNSTRFKTTSRLS